MFIFSYSLHYSSYKRHRPFTGLPFFYLKKKRLTYTKRTQFYKKKVLC